MSTGKTIHSRSNKNIGEILDDQWEITGKRVIAEPDPGDRTKGRPPRFGIYEYEVKAILKKLTASKPSRSSKTASEPSVGGTRREASSAPMVIRRVP